VLAIRLAVISKIIIDAVEGGPPRLGGGGVQAAVGAQLGAGGLSTCSLLAPVGMDFDNTLLRDLEARCIDTSGICRLPHVERTPGELIRYDGEKALWEAIGWDHWPELCAWVPPLPTETALDAIHVIVEGAGGGEVVSVLSYLAALGERALWPLVSVEPVMHDVKDESIAGLARLTAVADVVSPDLLTAVRIAHPEYRQLEQVDSAVVTLNAQGDAALQKIAIRCASALRLKPTALLAIRDSARGSYLLSHGTLTRVPTRNIEVRDPTGAGNAYAGALCAQLAAGASMQAAAEVASAVGAAFCRTDDWAPQIEEAVEWCFERGGTT